VATRHFSTAIQLFLSVGEYNRVITTDKYHKSDAVARFQTDRGKPAAALVQSLPRRRASDAPTQDQSRRRTRLVGYDRRLTLFQTASGFVPTTTSPCLQLSRAARFGGFKLSWRHSPAGLIGSHCMFSNVSVRPDQWCVFCTPLLATVLTRCNQLDSNLANLEATVEVA